MIFSRMTGFAMVFAATLPALAAGKAPATFLPGGNTKEPVNITSAKLDYFDKEKKLVYSGGVNGTQGESRIKCSTMVIWLAKDGEGEAKPVGGPAADNNSVEKVECAGPVTIVSKSDVGTGDNGLYDKIANKFFITGHVSLSQGPNVTTGDKLIYDMTSAQAIVTGNVHSLFVPGSNSGDAGKKKPAGK